MKNKALLITAFVFFILLNTAYYWEVTLGIGAMIAYLGLLIIFFILIIGFLFQMQVIIKERFRNKARITTILILAAILILSFVKPQGLIDFEKLEGENVLIAQRPGSANCLTTFKLKEKNKFYERIVCFSIETYRGTYVFKNDTIYFNYTSNVSKDEQYRFGVIKKLKGQSEYYYNLMLYKNVNDTVPLFLFISMNKLQ